MTATLTANQARIIRAMKFKEDEYGQTIYFAHESSLGTKAATPVLVSLAKLGFVERVKNSRLTDARAYTLTEAGRTA